MVQPFYLSAVKKTDFQLMKVINKDDNSDNDGSSSDDNDVKGYGDNYGDSYSNHEIYDDKNDNDDNSDSNAQTMNARTTLPIHIKGF